MPLIGIAGLEGCSQWDFMPRSDIGRRLTGLAAEKQRSGLAFTAIRSLPTSHQYLGPSASAKRSCGHIILNSREQYPGDLDERLHEAWIDQPDLMSRGEEPPAPIMRAGASLHRHHRRRQLFDRPDQFGATDLPRDDHAIAAMPWMWNDCFPRSIASRSSDMLSSFV